MKKKLPIPLLILAAVVIFYLWYTRPVTIWELFPEYSGSEIQAVYGDLSRYGTRETNNPNTPILYEGSTPIFSPDDPEYQTFLDYGEQIRFRRSLLNLIPQGPRSHRVSVGDYIWELHYVCSQKNIAISLRFDRAFLWDLAMDRSYFGSFVGQDTLAQEVYDYLYQYTVQTERAAW